MKKKLFQIESIEKISRFYNFANFFALVFGLTEGGWSLISTFNFCEPLALPLEYR